MRGMEIRRTLSRNPAVLLTGLIQLNGKPAITLGDVKQGDNVLNYGVIAGHVVGNVKDANHISVSHVVSYLRLWFALVGYGYSNFMLLVQLRSIQPRSIPKGMDEESVKSGE